MSLHVHDCWARSSIENKNPGSISKGNTGIRVMEKLILHRLVLLMDLSDDLSMSRILWRSKAHFCLAPSATLTRYVQPKCTIYISESLLKLHAEKKEKHTAIHASKIGVPRHHFGPPLFHPLSPAGWFEWILSPPRAAWAVRPCGESRGGFRRSASLRNGGRWLSFVRRTEMIGLMSAAENLLVRKPPHTEIRMPGTGGPGIRWNFHNGIHFWLPLQNGKNPWWWRGPACSVGRGGVVQLILRGAVRRPPKKNGQNLRQDSGK